MKTIFVSLVCSITLLAQYPAPSPVRGGGGGAGSGGGGGGGAFSVVSTAYTTSQGTYYLAAAGGTVTPATTEAPVQTYQEVAGTIQNLAVIVNPAPSSSTLAFTFRQNAASPSPNVTCSITGAAVKCGDVTHSFQQAAGDLTDIQLVVSGANYTGTIIVTWATPGVVGPIGPPASNAWVSLSGGVNTTTNTYTVGNGTTITPSGTGIINANQLNGTAFAGTSGHLTSFGAANIPADSGIVAANVALAVSPGAGIGHFAGSTQTLTSSLIVNADITNGTIAAAKLIGTDIATVGTITSGAWHGTIIAPTYGGTGVANTATLTLGSSNQNWATLGTGPVCNTTTTGALSLITLTTTGSSGASTLSGCTLNIPQYSGGGGSGTVTVVGAGSLTGTALVTGGGTTTIQTPNTSATMDSSGNISTPGGVTTGAGGSVSGYHSFGQGTATTPATSNIVLQAPTSVTAYSMALPGTAATGFLFNTNAAGVGTMSFVADPLAIAHGGTGTASTLTGLVRGSGSAMTAAELSGDATTSGSNAVTVVKINGTAFSGTNGHLVSFGAANIPADSGLVAANEVNASSPGAGVAHFAGSTQTVTSSAVVNADIANTTIDLTAKVTGVLPAANMAQVSPTAGTSVSLTSGVSQMFVCTSTCTVTVPAPAAGAQYCVYNDDNVSTQITLGAIGSSARYENTARTAYGTAGTGTFVSGGAVGDAVCIVFRDSTHYSTLSHVGTFTAN